MHHSQPPMPGLARCGGLLLKGEEEPVSRTRALFGSGDSRTRAGASPPVPAMEGTPGVRSIPNGRIHPQIPSSQPA
ncbi:hypothetical protein CHU98_g2624 [Xylaria longipes]|nr:hypothetical protein CHU98_g2624 [Xylaria longipes]